MTKRTDLRPPTPGARVVRNLRDDDDLTPQQLAQRKYKRSAKGRAANARARAKLSARPEWRAKEVRRVIAWQRTRPIARRVYRRIWARTNRRLARQSLQESAT